MPASVTVEARPYRLRNQVQTYAWGARNDGAFIPQLLGIAPDPGVPYAELWMGAHPKAPSTVVLPGRGKCSLPDLLAAGPATALGADVCAKFGGLPFLFKVLSAAQPLSIQAHPTRQQAAELHASDPEHYPDSNHKPEIAVALDGLTALLGFKPYEALRTSLAQYPELADFVGLSTTSRIIDARTASAVVQRTRVRDLLAALIQRAGDEPDDLADAVDALASRLESGSEPLKEAERIFVSERARYGSGDVGLFAMFLLNIVHLGPGEGIYTPAGVPHAYLGGNIVECMANSDNVVRVGLTPKYRDATALLRIADTTPGRPKILDGAPVRLPSGVRVATYEVPAPEFCLRRYELPAGATHRVTALASPSIFIVLAGSADVGWDQQTESYDRGTSAFVPACLKSYTIEAGPATTIVSAHVPVG